AILGYSDEEIPNDLEVWAGYVHPDDRQAVMEAFQSHIEGQTPEYIYEHRMWHKDGSVRWVFVRGTAIRDAQGNAVRVVGTDTDVTERRQAEEALRESEEKFRGLFENAVVGVGISNVAGRVLVMNRAMSEITGYTLAEFSGVNLGDTYVNLEDRKRFIEIMQRDGVVENLEVQLRNKEGEPYWASLSSRPIKYDGEDAVLTTTLDITEHKRAEESLRESEERFRTIFETAGVALWEEDFSAVRAACEELQAQGVTDFRRYLHEHPQFVRQTVQMIKVVDVNETAIKMFEAASKAELLASLDKVIGSEALDTSREEILALVEGRTYFECETVNQTLTGKRLNVLLSISFPKKEGKQNRVLVSSMDITERKQAEQERLKLKKLESVGLLAGGIAHDFNNLLTGLFGNIEMAKMFLSAEHKSHQFLESAGSSMDTAVNLTKQLLTFAKGGDPVKETLSIGAVITETAQFSIRGSNAKLQSHIAPD
ncbi:MAG: PAS domain S-box protein, partial [Chloroflexi bacterium]|nr:PAS domain S-box protein [Chloroflexota bacterium]